VPPGANRLYLDPLDPTGIVLNLPRTVTVPVLRLTTTAVLRVPPPSIDRRTTEAEALIDTGMWVSMVDEGTWQQYRDDGFLELLHHPETGLDPVPGNPILIAGASVPYSWGRLWVQLVDRTPPNNPNPSYLPRRPMPVVVQLLHRRVALRYPVLFGLHLGIFEGNRLTREPTLPWTPQPRNNRDCGTEYGQEWFLSDQKCLG